MPKLEIKNFIKFKPSTPLILGFLVICCLANITPLESSTGGLPDDSTQPSQLLVSPGRTRWDKNYRIKQMGGRLLLDALSEFTEPIQVDKYLYFVNTTTPTTPTSGHSALYSDNNSNKIKAVFSDGSITSLGGVSSVNASLGLTSGGSTGDVTLYLSTPINSANLPDLSSTYLTASSATATYIQKGFAATLSGNQTFTGFNVFSSSPALKGTDGSDNSVAGYVGEYVEGNQTTFTNYPATNHWGDGASVSLTAGDWDVSVVIDAIQNGATISGAFELGVSTTTGDTNAGLVLGVTQVIMAIPTATSHTTAAIPRYRVKQTTTKSVYLKVLAQYSLGNPQYACHIDARRIR